MLISGDDVISLLKILGINITGVLHIGAHDCEELPFYSKLGLSPNDIIWIDALSSKVEEAKQRGIPNVYKAVISDKDNEEVMFKVTNNVQSSSILDFGTHSIHHSNVKFVDTIKDVTTSIKSFYLKNKIDEPKYTFWNLDIQGVELLALKGAEDLLKNVKVIYTEVNTEEVYTGCAKLHELDTYLSTYGFTRIKTHMTPYGWGDAIYIKLHTQ